jgi:hypothetical protein
LPLLIIIELLIIVIKLTLYGVIIYGQISATRYVNTATRYVNTATRYVNTATRYVKLVIKIKCKFVPLPAVFAGFSLYSPVKSDYFCYPDSI